MDIDLKTRDEVASRWIFFRQWLRNPLSMAAISPSSRQLAKRMIAELPVDCRRVIEFGGGTGAITKALIDHGITPENLLIVELNADLYRHLRSRFPRVPVVHGSAADIERLARESGFDRGGPADAVVSGLGLLSMARADQRAILDAAFSVMTAEGRFIQFTYGPVSPVPIEVLSELGLIATRSRLTWWNLPPATVWVFSRARSRAVPAVPSRLR
ncbi:MAG TPA: methyltransferase type 12 [Xanthomonadales bacterium]|nr:methyltransferase type 12 [Xanthomonadales bacterium]